MDPILVLTGDLVASTRLDPATVDLAFSQLHAICAAFEPSAGQIRVARHRGDGWQVALTRPALGPRLALAIRAGMAALDPPVATRIALARGDGPLPKGDLNAAQGPAFVASGRLLDTMEGAQIATAEKGAAAAAIRLFDALSAGWTQAQARAIAPMLHPDPPTQTAAAATIGITRQSLAQALQGAHASAILDAIAMIEDPAA